MTFSIFSRLHPSWWMVRFCGLFMILMAAGSNPIKRDDLPTPKEIKFLQKFGYLDAPEGKTEALYKEEAVIEAIKVMQMFGGLTQTGKMDNATRSLLTKPRCGVPDIVRKDNHNETTRHKRYVIASDGWRKKHLSYFLSNWSPKLGSRENVLKELARAFKLWSDYSPLTFSHRENMESDIIISFADYDHGDGYPFDGPQMTLAHAFFPYDFSYFGGDIHFDDSENWIIGPGDDVEFFSVAAHEIGHSLGLGHSGDQESIMFPYYRGYDPNLRLGYDDIVAMHMIYASAKFEDAHLPPPPPPPPTNPTRPTTTGWTEKDNGHRPDNDDDSRGNTNKDEPSSTPTVITTTPYPTPPDPPVPEIPNICDGSYDTVALIRGELFIFKGQYMWRFRERKQLELGYPTKFRYLFRFPKDIQRIDAAYENEHDGGNILFFSGRNVYTFDGNNFIDRWPHNLDDLGIESYVDRLDAAFIWGKNGKTYFFSGSEYWKLDSKTLKRDAGYPVGMTRWRNLPYPVDTAFKWRDGQTYFFIKKNFYRFNDKKVRVDDFFPLPAPQYWFGCPEETKSQLQHSHRHKPYKRRSHEYP